MTNTDYLENAIRTDDKKVLKNLAEMGEMLKKLKEEWDKAEATLEAAKGAYEHYANVILPGEMHACGLDSITLATGEKLSIKRTFYCQPNKNAADQKIMADWLRSHNGAHLVKDTVAVAPESKEDLEKAGIPYTSSESFNTNSLKSFLKSGIGATTGVQQFTIDEIPACMHFQEVSVAEISK